MDISRNSASPSSPLRYDLTKPNRESIKERQPLDQPVETSADPAVDPEEAAKAVREARDAARAQRQGRVANARAHYMENNAPRFAQEVTDARNAHRAKLDERVKNTSGADAARSDRIEISDVSRRLIDSATRVASDAGEARSERLAELKALRAAGRLDTDEMIARAAHRMLGGE